tara:strand:- start:726 stop:1379 length:654 start_codon:yes stop_codon:yes gene_type:complete
MTSRIKINKKLPSYLKRTSKGGLLTGFIYVLTFMSILFLSIWQTFEFENNKTNMDLVDQRISVIEEQINIVDETNNDSMTDITSSIQFLDKEIRKLWDLSNKRNKANIENLIIKTTELENLITEIIDDVDLNEENLQLLKSETIDGLDKLDEVINDVSSLNSLKLSLNNIETQLILLEDSVQALSNYKSQLNQVILEIQTEISNAQNNATLNEVLQN